MSWASSEVVTVINFLLPGLVAAVIFASLTSSCGYAGNSCSDGRSLRRCLTRSFRFLLFSELGLPE